MASVNVDEIRSRVEEDWPRIVELIERKIALKSISAEGITGEQMRRSAEFVAEELRLVGIDAKVAQAHNADGTPGAWEVIGSRIVDPAAPTVLLYAHHDVQPVPDPSVWQTEPFVATQVGDRLFGRGSADDCGGIAIHSGALKALGDELKVNIKVFIEGEEEMGSPSFIPFIEAHRDEFDADVIIVADSGNWSADIPSLTTSLRGNTTLDVHVRVLEHPVHSGQYGGPILDANTLAAMLIASMYNGDGEMQVPGVAAEEPVGGLQRDLDEADVRRDAGIHRFAGLAPVDQAERDRHRLRRPAGRGVVQCDQPRDHVPSLAAHRAEPAPRTGTAGAGRLPGGACAVRLRGDRDTRRERHGLGHGSERGGHQGREAFGVAPVNKGEGGSIPFIPDLQRIFPEAQVLVTGPEDPKANAHSPNESISMPSLKKNIVTEALLLDKLAR